MKPLQLYKGSFTMCAVLAWRYLMYDGWMGRWSCSLALSLQCRVHCRSELRPNTVLVGTSNIYDINFLKSFFRARIALPVLPPAIPAFLVNGIFTGFL